MSRKIARKLLPETILLDGNFAMWYTFLLLMSPKGIKIRRSWNINPRLRIKESIKAYSRKRNKKRWQGEIKEKG